MECNRHGVSVSKVETNVKSKLKIFDEENHSRKQLDIRESVEKSKILTWIKTL